MGSWLIICGAMAAGAAGQPLAADSSPAAVERAIADLGDARYSVRERATLFLWQQGLAAEAALQAAAAGPDIEVRLRAARVLDDFRHGVLPGVPADIVALIRDFRGGTAVQRQAALQKLAARDRFDTLQRLIQLESDPNRRRQLLVSLLQHPRAVERFSDPQALRQFVAATGADQDELWRRTVFGQLLATDKMIVLLADTGRLAVLAKVIEAEESDQVRRQILAALFGNQTAVGVLLEKNQLDFVLQLILRETDQGQRGNWLSQLVSGPRAVEALVSAGRLERLILFVHENLQSGWRDNFFQTLTQNPAVGIALWKGGLDGLVKLAARETEPAARGRLLATLVTSPVMRQQAADPAVTDAVLKLVRGEKDATVRGEFLRNLANRGAFQFLFRETEQRRAIWQLVKAEAGADWRGDVLVQLVAQCTPEQLLSDKPETAWLLRFAAREALPHQTAQLIQRLFYDARWLATVIGHGQFAEALKLGKAQPVEQRTEMWRQLVNAQELAKHLAAAKQMGVLVTLAKEEEDAPARRQYLEALFQNATLMTALVADGQYEALLALAQADQEPVQRAALFGALLATEAAFKRFREKNELAALIAFAQNAPNAEARRQFLTRLFRNYAAMNALLDKGYFDALFALADAEQHPASRNELFGAFYSSPKVIDCLLEKKQLVRVLKFAQQEADENRRRQLLMTICQNERTLDQLLAEGHLEMLLSLVRDEKDKHARGTLLGALLASPKLLQRLAQRGEFDKLFAWLREQPDAEVRRLVLQGICQRPETVLFVIDRGRWDELLAIVQQEPQPAVRGQLLVVLIARPDVLQRLATAKRLQTLLTLARALDDPAARRPFLQTLLVNGPAVAALLEQGHFEALWELAGGDLEPQWQGILLGQFLSTGKTVEYLLAQKKLRLLLGAIGKQENPQVRRDLLRHLTTSEPAIAALIAEGQFDEFVKLCRAGSDARSAQGTTAELLLSARAVEHLDKGGRLRLIVEEALADTDPASRGQFLQELASRHTALDALMAKGYFELVCKALEQEPSVPRRRQLFSGLLTSPAAIRALAAGKRIDQALGFIDEEADMTQRGLHLHRLMSNSEALQTLVEAGQADRLYRLLERTASASRTGLLGSFLSHPAALRQMAAGGKLPGVLDRLAAEKEATARHRLCYALTTQPAGQRLLADPPIAAGLVGLIKAEPLPNDRLSLVQSAADNRGVWQALAYSGQSARLLELAALLPDAAQAKATARRMLYSPSGVIPSYLWRGDEAEAEKRLEQAADDDLGRVRLATYLSTAGRLEERIAAVQQRRDPQTAVADARLLTYLARAGGDLAAARRAAEQSGDDGLRRAVAVEHRDWPEAARLQAAGPCPLPIATYSQPPTEPPWVRIEQLSLTAAYQRLAGHNAACGQTLAELRQLTDRSPLNRDLRWMNAEALLLNDRVAEGVALSAETLPSRAFDMYFERRQFHEAFALVRWRAGAVADSAWVTSLPTAAARNDSSRTLQGFDIALQVVRALHALGQREEAEPLIAQLEAFAQEQREDGGPACARRQCWERLGHTLALLRSTPRAFEVAARAMFNADSPGSVLHRFYPRREMVADGWWWFFRQGDPAELPAATLQRVDAVMNARPDEDAGWFEKLVADAETAAATLAEPHAKQLRLAVAASSLQRGRIEITRRMLAVLRRRDEVPLPEALAWRWADALREAQQWAEAAERYEELWANNHDLLGALFLAGDALEHADRAGEGRKKKELADRLALDSARRRELAATLLSHGLHEEGVRQLQVVLRTAPLEHWEWNEAASRLGDHLADSDPAAAAEWLQLSVLNDLRWNYNLVDTRNYVRIPALIHILRAKAAGAAGQFERAEAHVELALAALPGDIRVAEQLVPLLDKAGRRAQADALFGRLYGAHQQKSQEYPQAAFLHNTLAWLSARCHRQLDAALEHARKANALAPNNAGYLDTLAETYFHRGDRASAVRHSQRANQLRPRDEKLKKQLARFEHDPLP